MNPEGLLYTKEHEWIRVEGDAGTVGITDHAQSELGDVVFVDLPEPGKEIHANDVFGSVESVKAVSELYAPIGGEVLDVNQKLQDKPEMVNSDPFGEAWMLRIRISNPNELKSLLSAAEYNAYVADLKAK